MSDMELINKIAMAEDDVVERPPEYVPLERIVNEIPCLDYDNPITYHLYATYNKNILTDEEHLNVLKSIEKLKKKRDVTNERCVEYLERNGSVPRTSVAPETIQNSQFEL